MDDPMNDQEWREAALLARGALLFDAAKKYGLVTGGPVVYVARCEELLARALARGVEVDDDEAAATFILTFNGEARDSGT
jgi:hypothetical protein